MQGGLRRRHRRRLSGGHALKNKDQVGTPAKAQAGDDEKISASVQASGNRLSRNDDEAERRAGRTGQRGPALARAASNRRLSVGPNRRRSIGVTPARSARRIHVTPGGSRRARIASPYGGSAYGVPQTALSQTQLADLYSRSVALSVQGKLSVKNAWNLNLVQNMDKILAVNETGEKRTHFQKASHTIHAASQIYGYRVDDVYQNSYKALSNFTSSAAGGNDDIDNSQEPAAKKRRVGALILTANALKADMRKITSEVDPMFHKTSTAFDEGGSKGLLLNSLTVSNGCDLVFDSTQKAEEENEEVEDTKNKESYEWITNETDVVQKVSNNFSALACPGMKAIHREVAKAKADLSKAKGEEVPEEKSAEPVPDNMNGKLNFEDSVLNAGGGDDFQSVQDADMFFGIEDNDELFDAEDAEQQMQQAIQMGVRPDGSFGGGSLEGLDNLSALTATADPYNDQNFAEVRMGDFEIYQGSAFMDETKNKSVNDPGEGGDNEVDDDGAVSLINPQAIINWAGPEMWSYRRVAAKRKKLKMKQKQEAEESKSKVKAVPGNINFQMVADAPQPPGNNFRRAKNPNSTMLNPKTQERSTILPDDLQWKRKFFAQLFIKSEFYCGFKRNVFRKQEKDSEGEDEEGDDWFNEELGGDDGAEDLWGAPPPEADGIDCDANATAALQLIDAPERLRHIDVDFAMVMKRINVKMLKTHIHHHITNNCDNEDAKKAAQAGIDALNAPSENPLPEPADDQMMSPHTAVAKIEDSEWSTTKSKPPPGSTTFAHTVEALQAMDPRQLSQISIAFCFMCTLHLANEANLRFEPAREEQGKVFTNFKVFIDHQNKDKALQAEILKVRQVKLNEEKLARKEMMKARRKVAMVKVREARRLAKEKEQAAMVGQISEDED